jgi:hypothetical protein
VHDAADPWPPTPLPNGENYIKLGHIAFSTMSVTESVSERHTAIVRSALFGGGSPPGAPTISNISPNTGGPGDSIANAIMTGTNLASVTTGDVTAPSTEIANIVVNSASAVQVHFDFDILAGASLGITTFTVTTPGGSASVTFNIAAPLGAPSIDPWPSISDHRKHGTETLTVLGDQFAAPMQIAFLAATPGDPDVLATATVVNLNQATVVVPGPFSPSPGDPAVVRTGPIKAITPAGTSADSPQPFILETI